MNHFFLHSYFIIADLTQKIIANDNPVDVTSASPIQNNYNKN